MKLKKILALLLSLCFVLPFAVSCESGKADPAETGTSGKQTEEETEPSVPDYDPAVTLFVSPDGDDTGDGSYEKPYATLAAARDAARAKKAGNNQTVTVYFRGGDYLFSETVYFDEADSGTVYSAWNREQVRFLGGVKVDPSLITSAADTDTAKRLLDQSKVKDLLVIDMSTLCENFEKLPDFWCNYPGHRNWEITKGDIYTGYSGLTRARWPNEGFVTTDEELNMSREAHRNADGDYDSPDDTLNKDSMSFYLSREVTDRVKQYADSYLSEIYIYGYFTNGYTHEIVRPYQLDTESGEMRLRTFRHPYEVDLAICHMYLLNIPEEIDLPGESFVDNANGKIYFLPTADYDINDVWYSTLAGNMISMNGAKDMTWYGIDFMFTRGAPICGDETDGITVDSCTVAYTDLYAIDISGNRTVIRNCDIHDTGLGCIQLKGGGDPVTLEESGCVVENCTLHDTSRAKFSEEFWAKDTQFINTECVATTIRHNVFYNCTMEAIRLAASNCIVEYNDFHDCNTECGDFGALYISEAGTVWGSVIRYNSFRNIGNEIADYGSHTIYFDGGMAGEIYGNLFYDATGVTESQQGVIKFGEAQCGYVHDNIFVDCWDCIWNAQSVNPNTNWILSYIGDDPDCGTKFYDGIMSVDFDSEYFHKCYDGKNAGRVYEYIDAKRIEEWRALPKKDLLKMMREGEIKVPENTTIVENNIFFNYRLLVRQYSLDLRDNYTDQKAEDTSIFVDYAGGDFRLTEEGLAKVKEAIPNFTGVPFEEIGIQK